MLPILQKSSILLVLLFTIHNAFGQYQLQEPSRPKVSGSENSMYLSFSSGIDNYTGVIGLGALVPVQDKLGVRLGLGLGAWGGKISGGLEYIDFLNSGIGIGLGYSHCPGISEVELEFPDQPSGTRTVDLSLLSAGSVNLTVKKNWVFKRGNIFYLESGYAFQTGRAKPFRTNDGTVLTADDELILNILRPGGIILALGFLVGL